MNKQKNFCRDYNIDLLRIVACFMVIVIHVAAYNWYDVSASTFEWKVYNIFDSIVRSAVPIFVMISGVFFLSSESIISLSKLYNKHIFKLIIVFVAWSCIYVLFDILFRNVNLSISERIISILNGPFHFWYIPTIIVLYIISPIIKLITTNCNKKHFNYILTIFLVAVLLDTISNMSFLPYIDYINIVIDKLPLEIFCQFYSYFILGYFLYKYEFSVIQRKIIYLCALLSVFLCCVLTYYISIYTGNNTVSFYDSFSIFTAIESIGLFLAFKHSRIKICEKSAKLIYQVSQCTLGIYLIHILVMYVLFDFQIISISSFNPIISVPVISTMIFFISLIIIYLIRKIRFIKIYFS